MIAENIAQQFSNSYVNILSNFYNIFTTFWSPGYVISVGVLDKVLWSSLLGPVIQFTYVFEHDVVIALTSDISEACLSAVKRKWPSFEGLKGVALKHHLVDGISDNPALLTGNIHEQYRHHQQ